MTLDLTTFDSMLKEYYTNDRVESLAYRDRPLLALLSKSEKFPGKKLPIPVQYADNQSISATFSVSQARSANTSSQFEAFELTRKSLYGTCVIDTETMLASESNDGAWFDARTTEINAIIEGTANVLAHSLYRSGWGDVGVVGTSGVSGATITLATTSDIHGIEVGQVHVFAGTQATTVLAGSGASLTVTGVNRNSGIVTYDANVSTVSGVTDGYYIFLKGCRQDSATPSMLMPAGLEGWSPYAGVTSTAWFGVDRTVDSRLGGLRYNGASDAPEDAILEMASRMAAQGRKPTHAFVSYGQFAKIAKAQRVYERFVEKVNINIGFEGIAIVGPTGIIKVVPDQFCPANRAFVVDMKAVKLYSIGKPVSVIDNDGNYVLRSASADAVECRVGFKGNLGCWAPNGIGCVQLTAAGV